MRIGDLTSNNYFYLERLLNLYAFILLEINLFLNAWDGDAVRMEALVEGLMGA